MNHMSRLAELARFGQSFWYDNIRRRFLQDGTIQSLIDRDGLRGITSNPSIFRSAVADSNDYDEQIEELAASDLSTAELFEALALDDIKAACDLFAPVYHESKGRDGYVSLEVSPHLAYDEMQTVAEARRLFAAVDRPNVMIKVPATEQGIRAVRQLIGQAVNINITLMFSMAHYEAVAQAYIDGLQQLRERGGSVAGIASVASFFVSRVDTAVDKKLAILDAPGASAISGKSAVANSRLVYQRFKEIFHGDHFAAEADAGAGVQRLLWASTSTKNPAYQDTMYVDELIGPETVNTMPPDTVDAFREHGTLSASLESRLGEARETLDSLADLGIDLNEVTEQLQVEGVNAFAAAYDALLETLEEKRAALAAV